MNSIIPVTEARAKLSKILNRVGRGEEFVITRHAQMIAKLVLVKKAVLEDLKQTVPQLRTLRKGVRVMLDEIIAWKNWGRP